MSYRRKQHYIETTAITRGEPVDAEIVDLIQNYGLTLAEVNELMERGMSHDFMRQLTIQYRQQYH